MGHPSRRATCRPRTKADRPTSFSSSHGTRPRQPDIQPRTWHYPRPWTTLGTARGTALELVAPAAPAAATEDQKADQPEE
jgi:hypothetical protein